MRADLLNRYPFSSPWVRNVLARYWLPVWFAANSIPAVALSARDHTLLFFDARLYIEATRAWLHGEDPWSVSLVGNYFAAPPSSMVPLVPLAMLPIDLGVAILAAAVIVGVVASVRLLGLPWWWMLFPPLVQCILAANTQGLLLPLLLLRLGWLATVLKIYAAIPMVLLGHWRQALLASLVLLITAPLLPWEPFIERFATISARLADQTNYALPTILLVLALPVAVLAMSIVGRERAAWLAVPAVWPSQQVYYGSLAIGARHQVAAAVVAFPMPGSGLIALLLLALLEWRRGARPPRIRRSSGRTRDTGSGPR